jgi:hypothetical protein
MFGIIISADWTDELEDPLSSSGVRGASTGDLGSYFVPEAVGEPIEDSPLAVDDPVDTLREGTTESR